MLDGELTSVLFIQTDGDFLATNRIEKDGNDWYFVLRYVYDYPKTKDAFDEEMAAVIVLTLGVGRRGDEAVGCIVGMLRGVRGRHV